MFVCDRHSVVTISNGKNRTTNTVMCKQKDHRPHQLPNTHNHVLFKSLHPEKINYKTKMQYIYKAVISDLISAAMVVSYPDFERIQKTDALHHSFNSYNF